MIPIAEPFLDDNELDNVIDCIKSTWISSKGEYIAKFEQKFSKYCGCKYGISCSNGTTSLHLALAALGIGKGDEVIVPTLTFIATANAVSYTGAKPVFVDSEIKTWNIDTDKIKEKITSKTKTIIPVHLYGHPCDMDPILEIADKYDLHIIEDAAEAHGAEYKSKKTGSLGDVGSFSFYGNKIITTGEGGMLVTNNEEFAEKASMLRDHGMSKEKKYWHENIGFNYRMTNIQAAIGLAQLDKIDKIIDIKRKNAKLYTSLLKDIDGVTLPQEAKWTKNVYWMYSIIINEDLNKRNKLISWLETNQIDSRQFFHPIHIMPPYKCNERFPIAEKLSKNGINLPSSPTLKKTEIKVIVEKIREFMIK